MNKKYYKEPSYIHYSNCHEDIEMIIKNANKSDEILSICSGLDNSLALLLLNPKHILAIDTNITQVYLAKLKKCAIKHFSYQEYKIFIGLEKGDSVALFHILKEFLDNDTYAYFNNHIDLISIGLMNCGRFEYYFRLFKKKILPLVFSKKTINTFMNFDNIIEQKEFYYKKINTFRYRLLFKTFFSERVMKRHGRDKEYFKYNSKEPDKLSDHLKKRFELGFVNNLNKNNPYLQYVFLNEFKAMPTYLIESNFNIIKENIDKLDIKLMSFDEAIKDNKYDLMNLSDIFEYMDNSLMEDYSKRISNSLNNHGRVMYWNMINTRRLNDLKEISVSLKEDRCFYYKAFYCYEK